MFRHAVEDIVVQLQYITSIAVLTNNTTILSRLQVNDGKTIWSTTCYITLKRTLPRLQRKECPIPILFYLIFFPNV